MTPAAPYPRFGDGVPSEPGIYRGLSYAEYHAIPAINHSSLEWFKRSPAHARENLLHPTKPSEAFAFGQGFHMYVLEPERFGKEYAIGPDCARRNKSDKERWDAFEAANPDRLPLAPDEAKAFHFMREAIMSHATARELLTGRGACEVVAVWRDEETGLLCKARIDRVGEVADWSFVVDLKTARDASPRAFSRDVGEYGYHRQLAWYRDGLGVIRPVPRRAAIVAVEKTPPYAVAVYELEERALEQGARESRRHLNAYANAMASGNWPGYDAGFQTIDVPAWMMESE